ncbi:hypothetical protein IGI04_033443 [Brassica rapa subsp. trilocularis]|uniref:Uncharacterized protein n=1 Tax=Brassica rapa subsp. trilocularis TaxID=1813537 RepID=A0ABQ7L966_BRACM|nr:hypothetical protein IGI04_033443 [Brassica rapa subsp. trilocularis]
MEAAHGESFYLSQYSFNTFRIYPRVSASSAASALAAAAASMKTVVPHVLCRDRRFYRRQPQDAAFGRGVRRSFLRQRNEQELTQNVDAAAAADTCDNQTNSPIVSFAVLINDA